MRKAAFRSGGGQGCRPSQSLQNMFEISSLKLNMKSGLPAIIWHQNTGHDIENNQTQRPTSALKRKLCSVQLISTAPCLTYLISHTFCLRDNTTMLLVSYVYLKIFQCLLVSRLRNLLSQLMVVSVSGGSTGGSITSELCCKVGLVLQSEGIVS